MKDIASLTVVSILIALLINMLVLVYNPDGHILLTLADMSLGVGLVLAWNEELT